MPSTALIRFTMLLLASMGAVFGLWLSPPVSSFISGFYWGIFTVLLLFAALRIAVGRRSPADADKDQAQMASELRAAQHAASLERGHRERHAQWISVIAHEFKTPLSIIDTTASSIEALVDESNEAVQKRCHKIQRAVTRLNSLLTTYLAEERLLSDLNHLNPQLLDVASFMERTLRGVLLPPEPQIELRLDLTQAPAQILADRLLLQLMLNNLLGNAVKFSPRGGVITLQVRTVDRDNLSGIEIQVSDQGIGIEQSRLAHLFDHYVSGDDRLHQGDHVSVNTGIGLWAVRESVTKHRGNIRVESQPGQGTRFTIWLPVTSVLELA